MTQRGPCYLAADKYEVSRTRQSEVIRGRIGEVVLRQKSVELVRLDRNKAEDQGLANKSFSPIVSERINLGVKRL